MIEREAMAAAELAEAEYMFALFDQAPEIIRESLGLRCRRVGGGVVTVLTGDPTASFWSRVIGLGTSQPISAQVVDEVLDFARDSGAEVLCFQVAPDAEGPWEQLLSERGAAPSRAWVKLASLVPVSHPRVSTDLRTGRLGPDDAMEYGWLLVRGFEMPENPHLASWFAGMVTTPGFLTYGAWDGDRLVAAAASHTANCRTVLCGAATLPEGRGRGAQSALIAHRLADAEAEHSVWICSETGAETPEAPNPSLHNLVRMGLTPRYERRNWVWTAST